ncbi:hypothetical protein E2C01_068870 [Portunus trituberculatus]|uniref:Uncharacterized protein n=1 Tax=Portunus trituberculatus TaxID=210409 RepID=A0A5B7HPZ2_PORTR|nr:hypothetical protein [Portunus trituberculatus]
MCSVWSGSRLPHPGGPRTGGVCQPLVRVQCRYEGGECCSGCV